LVRIAVTVNSCWHVQTGLGRTTTTTAAYLSWAGEAKSAQAALELVSKARRMPLERLIIPTQTRSVGILTSRARCLLFLSRQ
jgi:hypothetical protein